MARALERRIRTLEGALPGSQTGIPREGKQVFRLFKKTQDTGVDSEVHQQAVVLVVDVAGWKAWVEADPKILSISL